MAAFPHDTAPAATHRGGHKPDPDMACRVTPHIAYYTNI